MNESSTLKKKLVSGLSTLIHVIHVNIRTAAVPFNLADLLTCEPCGDKGITLNCHHAQPKTNKDTNKIEKKKDICNEFLLLWLLHLKQIRRAKELLSLCRSSSYNLTLHHFILTAHMEVKQCLVHESHFGLLQCYKAFYWTWIEMILPAMVRPQLHIVRDVYCCTNLRNRQSLILSPWRAFCLPQAEVTASVVIEDGFLQITLEV